MRFFLNTCALCLLALAATSHAQTSKATAENCRTTKNYQVKLEGPRVLENGTTEYSGHFAMWPPSGNPNCRYRQIEFWVPRLSLDNCPLSAGSPVITVTLPHGLFHRTPKDMRLYQIVLQSVTSTAVEYEIDAEASKPYNGTFYADISVVGTHDAGVCPTSSL